MGSDRDKDDELGSAQQGMTLDRALSDTEKAAGEATRSGWWPSS